MPQMLTRLLVHVVFSTKDRAPWINASVEPELFAYMGGVCRGKGCVLEAAGAASDHVHLLVSLSKTVALSDLMMELKRDSSVWMKSHSDHSSFGWQNGYSAFTIGESGVEDLLDYFASQRSCHATRSFQDELRRICDAYGVSLDERYAWD